LLKVFLGYAAGVGKSFAMLQAAQVAQLQGRTVAVGWAERHDRPDTLELLAGLPEVPPRVTSEGSLTLRELDLDACLQRHPEVLLVDELAHSNAPGSRHQKRWQDVKELLDAGIEVWTTVNVQHLESMNDVVARITGVQVQETVPDSLFDRAQEVEIVDVDPEDLVDRLKAGKVYRLPQAQKALESFFRKENLLALRELTFRRAAERVGKEVDHARTQKNVQAIWPVRERLMVSVGPSPLSEDLLRQAARMARSLDAELLAVSIETPSSRLLDSASQARLAHNLGVAEALGAETVILQGEDVARDLVAFARKRNVTKLVIGKNRDTGWKRFLRRTIGDELLRLSGDIDVYVLTGRKTNPSIPEVRRTLWQLHWKNWIWAVLLVAGFAALAILFRQSGMAEANLILTLLMSVVLSASLFGLSASIVSSVLSVLAFNFFFTQPQYSLAVDDPQYYLVFVFLLIVGLVIGALTHRLRTALETSRTREQRIETLNRMHRQLAELLSAEAVQSCAEALVQELLGSRVQILLRDRSGQWLSTGTVQPGDVALFDWSWEHNERAGWGTGTLFRHRLSVWPLTGTQGPVGILALESHSHPADLVESLAALITSALERVGLIEQTRTRDRQVENERTRNAILHSLSHDLRTPLAVLSGSLEALALSSDTQWAPRDLGVVDLLKKEADGLARQVENLLELSRLSDQDWSQSLVEVPVEEPVQGALERFSRTHPQAVVQQEVPAEVLTAPMEPRLVHQALINFLENAWEYAGSEGLECVVTVDRNLVRYEVRDRGPGVSQGERGKIFQKFVRGSSITESTHRGTGLGLAIVTEVARVHNGRTGVEDRPGGGSIFFLEFPRWQS